MRFAYADPPYFGYASYYAGKHADAAKLDSIDAHAQLIADLAAFDGWALSMTSGNLREIYPLCPIGARVAAWVKPFASFKPGVNPGYAWEPVVFFGSRKRSRTEPTVRDWVSANITLERGLIGAKPRDFCFWVFQLLGARKDDEMVDLFPGTGAVTAAWKRIHRAAGRLLSTVPGGGRMTKALRVALAGIEHEGRFLIVECDSDLKSLADALSSIPHNHYVVAIVPGAGTNPGGRFSLHIICEQPNWGQAPRSGSAWGDA